MLQKPPLSKVVSQFVSKEDVRDHLTETLPLYWVIAACQSYL